MPNSIADLKRYLSSGTNYLGEPIEPVSMTEFNDFWKSLSDQEKEEFKNTELSQN